MALALDLTFSFGVLNHMEKNDLSSPGLINAGQYLLSKGIINDIPEKNIYSLEKEFFPKLINWFNLPLHILQLKTSI